MASPHRVHPNYLAVWVWLAALMLVSVLASYLPTSAVIIIGIVLVLAFIKALLVALYYMHLKFERPLLLILVIAPLVLAAILITALLPDSAHARHEGPRFSAAATNETHAGSPAH